MFRFLRRVGLFLVAAAVGFAVFSAVPSAVQAVMAWALLLYLVRCGWGQMTRDAGAVWARVGSVSPPGRRGGFRRSRVGDL